MTEIRCVKCRRLLMKVSEPFEKMKIAMSRSGVEVKCPKCRYLNLFTFCVEEGVLPKPENLELMRLS